MIRTQVQLTEQQLARLRTLAVEQGSSISQLVRDGVDKVLGQTGRDASGDKVRRAIAAAGRFRSGSADVARRHDDYLAAAYGTTEE